MSEFVACMAHTDKGEVDVSWCRCDKIASCWSCNKLNVGDIVHTISSSEQKTQGRQSCVLSVFMYWHCCWGVGSLVSTVREMVYSPTCPTRVEGMGKLVHTSALLRAQPGKQAGYHHICARGNRTSPSFCSDCSQQSIQILYSLYSCQFLMSDCGSRTVQPVPLI